MDRRQQKTRQAVFAAFTKLLEEKTYTRITVQEIIDEANIGRSTFYSHFDTKEELLRALNTEIFDHVFAEHLDKERTHDFSSDSNNIESKITHILYHIQDSKGYIKGLLSCESGEMFMHYFKEHLARALEEELEKVDSDLPHDYLVNHTVNDFAETVRWWIRNENYSPEDVAHFFLSTSPFGY